MSGEVDLQILIKKAIENTFNENEARELEERLLRKRLKIKFTLREKIILSSFILFDNQDDKERRHQYILKGLQKIRQQSSAH